MQTFQEVLEGHPQGLVVLGWDLSGLDSEVNIVSIRMLVRSLGTCWSLVDACMLISALLYGHNMLLRSYNSLFVMNDCFGFMLPTTLLYWVITRT